MSKSQRDKGKRNEYLLRDYLRQRGWKADRVPSSGAAEGFKGDIKAEKDGRQVLFELKARAESFTSMYDLYAEQCRTQGDDLLAVAVPGAKHLCVSMSSSLDALFDGPETYPLLEKHPLFPKHPKAFKRFTTLQKLLGAAEILALKDDRRHFLFLRFR